MSLFDDLTAPDVVQEILPKSKLAGRLRGAEVEEREAVLKALNSDAPHAQLARRLDELLGWDDISAEMVRGYRERM